MQAVAIAAGRCAPLRTIVVILCLTVSAGCSATAGQAPTAPNNRPVAPAASTARTATPDDVAPGTLVMVIRHGEKPTGSQAGLDAQGHKNDHGLTTTGWQRANHLVDLFDPAHADLKPGLARPAAVYAAKPNDLGDGLRTRETVTPLADRLGIRVNTDFGKGEEKALVAQVIGGPGPTLISWQHEEIPAIAREFPSVTPIPPTAWPDNRYDVVWTLTKTAEGWSFAQVPELVLPGDAGSVIR